MTTYEQFEEAFNNSSLQNEYLVYDDQFREFLDAAQFDDLLAVGYFQTRSYPWELLNWAKETLKFLYDDSIEKVDASKKEIPQFLLKDQND